MKILITGIGIVGKSSFRRQIVKSLRKSGLRVEHFDADGFCETRSDEDADCVFLNHEEDSLYFIEDVHGTTQEATLPLKEYQMILYILPQNILSHTIFWISRMWQWFRSGRFSWERDTGWNGTGRPFDPENIIPIWKEFLRNLSNRKQWIKEDLETIRPFAHFIVRSRWAIRGIRWSVEK